MKKLLGPAAIASVAVAFAFTSVAVQAQTTGTGIFTAAQAERGKAAYGQSCATCHGPDLVSVVEEAPSLSGFTFGVKFVGKTVADRFNKIKTTMPIGGAGSLTDQTYLDIIAYILSFNRYPAGSQELTPATDLNAITITKAP